MGRALSHPLFPYFAVVSAFAAAGVCYWRDAALHPAAALALGMAAAALAISLRNSRLIAAGRPTMAGEINGLHDAVDDLIDVHEELRDDVDHLLREPAQPLPAPRRAAPSLDAEPGFEPYEEDLDDEFQAAAAHVADDAPAARPIDPFDALPPAAARPSATGADGAAGSIVEALRAAAPRASARAAPAEAPRRRNPTTARAAAQSRLMRDLARQRAELDDLRSAADALDHRRRTPPDWSDPSQGPEWSVPRFVRRGTASAEPTASVPAAAPGGGLAVPAPSASNDPVAAAEPARPTARRRRAEPKVIEIAARRDAAPTPRPFDPDLGDERSMLTLRPMAVLSDGKPLFYEAVLRVPTPADAASGHAGARDNLALIKSLTALERIGAVAPEIGVFCPLSLHSLRDDAFLDALLNFLEQRRTLVSRLVIEISQVELGPDPEADASILTRLRDHGVTLSLGHVLDLSVEPRRLHRLGFRYIKLDCETMVGRENASPGALAHLTASFRRAGLDVIVEKIDGPSDKSTLAAAGVRFGQGRVIGSPIALGAVVADIQLARASRRALGDRTPAPKPGAEPASTG